MADNPVTYDFSKAIPIDATTPEQKQADTLRQSVAYGASQNPEQHALRLRLWSQTGVPPEVSQGNEQDIQHAADVNKIDYDQMAVSHPRTTKWASNPDNAAVSGVDEIQRLAGIELAASHIPTIVNGQSIFGEARALTTMESLGMTASNIHRKLMEYPLTRMAVDIAGGVAGMAGDIGSVVGWHGDDGKKNALQRLESYLSVNNTDLNINGRPDRENGLDWLAKNVAPMIPAMFVSGGTSLVARTLGISDKAAKVLSGFSVGAMFTAQQGGRTYTQMAESGANDYDARLAANRVSAINAPVNALFGVTHLSPFLERTPFLTSLAIGGATGASGQLAQNVITKRPLSDNIVSGALEGAALQGGMHLGMGFFDGMGQIIVSAEQSKLRARSPEKFHEAMQEIFDGHDSLRIPAEQFATYFQSKGMDPVKVAEQIGVKNFTESRLAGTDLEVAPADFTAKLESEHQEGLLGDIVNPQTGLTLNQQREGEAELQQWVKDGGAEKLIAETAQVDAETAQHPDYPQIRAEASKRLQEDFGMTPEVADSHAQVLAMQFVNAERAGMSPLEYFNARNPKVTLGEAPQNGLQQDGISEPVRIAYDESGNVIDGDGRHRIIAALERGDKTIAIHTTMRDGSVQTLHVDPQLTAEKLGVTPESLRATDAQQAEFFKTLYQEATAASAQPRGWFRVLPDGSFEMGMTPFGNASTPIHEALGHPSYFMLRDLASREGASEQLKADLATAHEWLGVKAGEKPSTDQMEKWARAIELYFTEGKAPTSALKGAFQRIAVWLSSVYREAKKQLGVEIPPQVRDVMDRWFAASDVVERAAAEGEGKLFTSPEEAGWTPEQFQAHAEANNMSVEQAKAEILAKLNEAAIRERSDSWREEERNVREAVTVDVDKKPEYTAIRSLRKGAMDDGTELTLNREELVKQFGEERVKELQKQHPGLYRKEGGVDPETAAEILGFNSGEEMLRALETTPRRSQAIEQGTRAYMTSKHGDIRYDGSLDDQARIALENDKRAENLHSELQALQKQVEALKTASADQKAALRAVEIPPVESFRAAARQMVSEKPLLDLQPTRYLDASRKASREAFDASRKGDVEAATKAKQKELINHFLFREATKAKAEADKIFTSVKNYSKATVREKIAKAGGEEGQHVYLDQIDNILEAFRFVRESAQSIREQRQKFADFAAQKQAEEAAKFYALNPDWAANHPEGELPEIAQVVDTSIAGVSKNYRELNINELRAVRDSLRNIEVLARKEWGIQRDGKLVSFEQEVADFSRIARESNRSKYVPLSGDKLTAKERFIKSIHGLDAFMQKIEWLVDRLDGGDVNGPARRNIKKPIDDAWGKSLDLGDEIFGKLKTLIDARPKADVSDLESSTPVKFPKRDKPLTRAQLISWALNLGTEENQKVALLGEGLIGADGSPAPEFYWALNSLRKSEWEFVQGVWDVLDGMLPAVREKSLRTTGIEPKLKKVTSFEVTPVDDPEPMTMRGGYYPLKSEPGDRVGMKQNDPAQLMAVGYQKPKTSTSHLQQVTGATYRLQLDYQRVLSKHLADVISDTTKGEAISEVYRFISNDDVRQTMQQTLGDPESREFLMWLQDFAGNNKSDGRGNDPLLKFLMSRRSGMVAARLGGNLGSYLIQMGDVFKSFADPDIKTKYLAKAFLDIRRNPTKMIEEIRALSPNEMRHREKNFNREISDMLTERGPFDQKRYVVTNFLMDGFAVMDRLVTFPAWLARFRQGMAEHGDQTRAAAEADRAIARDYQAGDPRNMSHMMRKDGYVRLLTTFQGDANTWYGIISAAVRSGNTKAISVGIMALVGEQVVGQFIKNRGPKDDESWAGWLTEQALLAGISKVPVLGDWVQYGMSKLTGQYASLQNPTMQALEKTGSAPGSIYSYMKGTKDGQQMFQDLTEATGIWLGIPGTSQSVRTWKYIHNVGTGKEPAPRGPVEAVRGAAQGSNRKH